MHKDFYVQPPLAHLKGVRLAVAQLVIQGYTESQIAGKLCLSLSSIKKYVVGLKEQMNCATLHGLSAKLMRLSLEHKTNPSFFKKGQQMVLKINAFLRKKEKTKLLGGAP